MRHTHNLSSPKSTILDEEHFSPPLAMPRSILLRPLGGASGKVRKRYALVEKLMLIDESNRLRRECNLSLRKAAEVVGVPFQVLARWHKELPMIRAAIADQPRARNKKSILDGPASTLRSIEMELLQFMFTKCKQGINVRHTLVACKTSALLHDNFGPKSFNAKLNLALCGNITTFTAM